MLIRLTAAELVDRWFAREADQPLVEQQVADILSRVKAGGDQAIALLSREIEGFVPEPIYLPQEQLKPYLEQISPELRQALTAAAGRIADYHRRQLAAEPSALLPDQWGGVTGWITRPLRRVACYVPGGRSPYPSSVLMTAIPARVAGVEEVVVVTPPRRRKEEEAAVMAAACLAGVTGVYRLGGAVAVAAMAYGSETIAPADKIVGPGNRYVEAAKAQVAGVTGIDLPAGPSELVVIADSGANPRWLAADMLSQAEHSPDAAAALISTSAELIEQVGRQMQALLPGLTHAGEATASLGARGGAVVVDSLEAAIAVANTCAPEHLQLCVQDPWAYLGRVTNAGAVFLGYRTPVALGDYWAGPSHVLPTGGAARYASPLGVNDFCKRISVVSASPELLSIGAAPVAAIARQEGFDAHALSVELRNMGQE